MRKRILHIVSLLLFFGFSLHCQESTTAYSTGFQHKLEIPSLNLPPLKPQLELNMPEIRPIITPSDSLSYNELDLHMNYTVPPKNEPFAWKGNIFSRDFTQSGVLTIWDNGHIAGFSSYKTMPILGSVGSAGFGIDQDFGERLNFSGGISFNKYNLPHNAYNSFALNGQLTYTLNRNLSLSAFGSYESTNFLNSNPYMPYSTSTNYGGFLTANTNNQRWGVDVGAQRYYDPYRRRWMTMPIVRPYYNLNGYKLGVDVGSILNQLLESVGVFLNGKDDYNGFGRNVSAGSGANIPAKGKFLMPGKR